MIVRNLVTPSSFLYSSREFVSGLGRLNHEGFQQATFRTRLFHYSANIDRVGPHLTEHALAISRFQQGGMNYFGGQA